MHKKYANLKYKNARIQWAVNPCDKLLMLLNLENFETVISVLFFVLIVVFVVKDIILLL